MCIYSELVVQETINSSSTLELSRHKLSINMKAVFALFVLIAVASATQKKQRQARQEQPQPASSFDTAFFPPKDYETMLEGAAYWRIMTGQMVEMLKEVSLNVLPSLNSAAYRALPHTVNMAENSANLLVELDTMSSPPLQNYIGRLRSHNQNGGDFPTLPLELRNMITSFINMPSK